ncbi:SMP-30/gluconolactonase/LRE family protein [Comamonadaceae bacterium G21597-S1]|nr:SMP-30/gluconolactonase/LRE family protein [Comamonadaceae bacterium G21597-S1]
MNTPTIVSPTRDRLGECPLWDSRDDCLYWIDSKAPVVRRLHPASGGRTEWPLPSDVGSIALTETGRILLALADGFHLLDPRTGAVTPVAKVTHKAGDIRMNDGRTDRQGRFIAGSLVVGRHDRDGAFYRLDTDGTVHELVPGIALANSTCFSPDGRTLYFADSMSDEVRAAGYDPDTGALGTPRALMNTRAQGSAPDGATVDAEGCLWVALVQAGKLGRYAPDGSLMQLLDVPTPFPSCPCFGGPELDVLYVTSLSNTGNLMKTDHPDGGALFAFHGLGVRGLPETRFDDRALV